MDGTGVGNLGRILEDLHARARIKAAAVTMPAAKAAQDRFVTALMERMESELGPQLQTVVQSVLDNPDTPDEFRTLFASLSMPQHQSGLILQIFAFGGLILGGFQAAAAGQTQIMRNHSLSHWPYVPLTPEEAAAAVVKGHLDEGAGAAEARISGIDGGRFGTMVETTGSPPGPQELGIMLNRGIIDEGRFGEGVRQGLIRTDWTGPLLAMRHGPIGIGEGVAATVEGHIGMDQLRQILSFNGVAPENADVLYETAGNPPGVQELIELWRRDAVSQDVVAQAIRESHYKDKYIPAILSMFVRVPPARTVVAMMRNGSIDATTGLDWLRKNGIVGDEADAMVRDATREKTAKTRDLAASQIVSLYEIQAIDHDQAAGMIEGLGYDPTETEMLLVIADSRRVVSAQNAYIARIHNLYVGHKIDRAAASTELDVTNVPHAQRDLLIQLWDLERAANVATLTLAQLQRAFKYEIIDRPTFEKRVSAMGYTDDDVQLLVALTLI